MTRELHTSTEAREKVSEMISELRASAMEERESVMKELESYREARKQLSQEMIELRASTEREKELLTRELKAYKEAGKQGMSERAAASPSNESDETDASSPTLLRKFTGIISRSNLVKQLWSMSVSGHDMSVSGHDQQGIGKRKINHRLFPPPLLVVSIDQNRDLVT